MIRFPQKFYLFVFVISAVFFQSQANELLRPGRQNRPPLDQMIKEQENSISIIREKSAPEQKKMKEAGADAKTLELFAQICEMSIKNHEQMILAIHRRDQFKFEETQASDDDLWYKWKKYKNNFTEKPRERNEKPEKDEPHDKDEILKNKQKETSSSSGSDELEAWLKSDKK